MKSILIALLIYMFLTFSVKAQTNNWQTEIPNASGLNTEILSNLNQVINHNFPQIKSFLISYKGKLIFEKYPNSKLQNELHQICSVTKSITSILIGIAIKQKLIKSINDSVIEYFPEYNNKNLHPEFRDITIRHLLTMSPGFNINDTPFFNIWQNHQNPTAFTFGFRPDSIPGTHVMYNGVGVHLLSALIKKVSGKKLSDYANENLFEPLDIKIYKWLEDKQGNSWGNFKSWYIPRDLLRFGNLILQDGSWNGKQIIDKEYLKESTQTQITGELFGSFTNYGYLWYIGNYSGIKSLNGSGYGGQFIYIFPEYDMVVVCTSGVERHYHENYSLISNYIIPLLND